MNLPVPPLSVRARGTASVQYLNYSHDRAGRPTASSTHILPTQRRYTQRIIPCTMQRYKRRIELLLQSETIQKFGTVTGNSCSVDTGPGGVPLRSCKPSGGDFCTAVQLCSTWCAIQYCPNTRFQTSILPITHVGGGVKCLPSMTICGEGRVGRVKYPAVDVVDSHHLLKSASGI